MRFVPLVSFVATAVLVTSTAARISAQINFAGSTLRVASEAAPQSEAREQSSIPGQAPRQFEEPTAVQPLPQADPAPTPPIGVQQRALQQRAAQQSSALPALRRASGVQQASYESPAMPVSHTLVHAPTGRGPTIVYGSANARANMNTMPRSAAAQMNSAAGARNPRGKPFQGVASQPSVSPYLSLFNSRGGDGSVPLNYFTSIQPQLQQQEAVRQQAIELRRLQNQVQSMQTGGMAAPNSASAVHARFMDTGGFYHGR